MIFTSTSWGKVDVEDCCNGALYVANSMKAADLEKLCIDGGSAGGFTTLACLTKRSEVFKAGASMYGVSDVEALARDTHKFESRYMDSMIGPLPECIELYKERSPIYHVDKLICPMIFFQGDEDKVINVVLYITGRWGRQCRHVGLNFWHPRSMEVQGCLP